MKSTKLVRGEYWITQKQKAKVVAAARKRKVKHSVIIRELIDSR